MKNSLLLPLFCFFLLVFLTKNQKENACNSVAVAKGIIQTTSQAVVQDTLTSHEFQYELAKQKSKEGLLTAGAVLGYIAAVGFFLRAFLLSLFVSIANAATSIYGISSGQNTAGQGAALLAVLIFILAVVFTIQARKSHEIRKKMEKRKD
jgi:vacuolar-type H+-ATPase subunit I/STV1